MNKETYYNKAIDLIKKKQNLACKNDLIIMIKIIFLKIKALIVQINIDLDIVKI